MMYKDKEKQRQAHKESMQRLRLKLKGITEGITEPQVSQGITGQGVTYPTGSTCNSFETLPLDVQQNIERVNAWCKQRDIEDSKSKRIQRAIHYQQYVRAG